MKKVFTLAVAAFAMSVTAFAQSKFDAATSLYVSQAQENVKARKMSAVHADAPKALGSEIAAEQRVSVMVCMRTPDDVELLREAGYEVQSVLGRIAVVMLTASEMEAVAAMDQTVEISMGYGVEPTLSKAREITGVSAVQSPGTADGLDHGYTGNGVVVGLMDTGLDVGHINFRDTDGKTRIKRLWVFQGTQDDGEGNVTVGNRLDFESEDAIEGFVSSITGGADTDRETHATHVLGIIAGSYNQNLRRTNGGKFAGYNNSGTPDLMQSEMPYYGVAKDAEIAACCGTLHDPCIITAADELRKYSQAEGKPAVFNLSLGNTIGPHDGTDNASEALAEAGKDILICISAGNEGNSGLWVKKDFTGSDNTLRTCISKNASTSSGAMVDIWGGTSERLKVRFVAVDASGNIKYSLEIPETSGATRYIGGSGTNYSNVAKDPQFDVFGAQGYIGYRTNVNVKNNRYNIALYPHLSGGSKGYYAALIIESSAGNSVNAFGRNLEFYSNNIGGYVGSTGINTINGMACGDNVLVVGSYVSGEKFPVLTGSVGSESTAYYSFNNSPQGSLSSFSSSGQTFSGRQLPDVVGPGQGVISSYSKFYIKSSGLNGFNVNDAGQTTISAYAYASDKKTIDYWAEMSGTSMSSPFVAGVLALWSQAAEEKGERLTMDRVKEIISKTADHDQYTSVSPERWGMGKINALAGIKYILTGSGVNDVAADDPANSLIVENMGGKVYNVFLSGTDGFTATLYNLQGVAVAQASTTGSELRLDGSALGSGVYVLAVDARNTRVSRKLAL